MKQPGARPLLILAALTAIGILAVVVWAASQRSSSPSPGVHIGTAASITRPGASAYTVGAAFRHFATATIAQSCGAPTSGVTWNGRYATQQFAPNCTAHARFRLTTPTPQPQPTGPAPTAAPRPTGTPLPSPTVTPNPSSPTAFLLSLLNGHRSAAGVPPLALSDVQSMGTATCAGSIGHSQAMQQSGSIWHVNPLYVAASFPNNLCVAYSAGGENVGSGAGSEQSATQSIDGAMMSEPHDAVTCAAQVNHACSILNPRYTQIGIGLVYINSVLFLTEDFVG